jgi:hypothetical protein
MHKQRALARKHKLFSRNECEGKANYTVGQSLQKANYTVGQLFQDPQFLARKTRDRIRSGEGDLVATPKSTG